MLYNGEGLLNKYCKFDQLYAFMVNWERMAFMGTAEILSVALFCFSMVFALLGVIYLLVKLSTGAIRFLENRVNNSGR